MSRLSTGQVATGALLWLLSLCASAGAGAQSEPDRVLFPEPFRLTHAVRLDPGTGAVVEHVPVTDTYGGQWIVSERQDGSRTIVDLARSEITEVHPAEGVTWTITFARLRELGRRLRQLQGLERDAGSEEPGSAAAPLRSAVSSRREPLVRVTEVALGAPLLEPPAGVAASPRLAQGVDVAGEQGPVRRLRVREQLGEASATEAGAAAQVVEVWVAPSLRLGPRALEALARFETVAAGPRPEGSAASPGELVAAARRFAAGAVPVRTVRRLELERGSGWIEDRVLRIERLVTFPAELLAVPATLARQPHPLELAVGALERERSLERGGRR